MEIKVETMLEPPPPDLKAGDVISIGKHWSVPQGIENKYFKVLTVEPDGTIRLSKPYLDRELTKEFHTIDPMTRKPAQLKKPPFRAASG